MLLVEEHQTITMLKIKLKKKRELINTRNYDADIARYIPGVLEMKFQGVLEDIDTREKVAHSSYKDMEELDFQILLTNNYYVNPNNIHFCFPMEIKKSSNESSDIDGDVITVNNSFGHLINEIIVAKYGSDKELITTLSPCKIYQYSDAMLKIFQNNHRKDLKKQFFIGSRVSIIATHR